MSDKDGGPAFPTVVEMAPVIHNGMSLRDWFAGLALTEIYATASTCKSAAEEAYYMADAMLAERLKL